MLVFRIAMPEVISEPIIVVSDSEEEHERQELIEAELREPIVQSQDDFVHDPLLQLQLQPPPAKKQKVEEKENNQAELTLQVDEEVIF